MLTHAMGFLTFETLFLLLATSWLTIVVGATSGLLDHPTTADGEGVGHTLLHNTAFGNQLRLVNPQDATVENLALTDNDEQYFGVAVAAGDVFFASSSGSIYRASPSALLNDWETNTVVSGRVTVRVTGYNLAANLNDVALFSIRGVKCSTLRRESSNSLVCVSGHPALTVDGGEGITADDVVVQTITGGRGEGAYPGDFVDAKLADHSLEPIITGVDKSSREISPHALAVDHSAGILYYSDVSARSIERVRFAAEDGEIAYDGLGIVEWGTFLPNVGLVYGMAVDAHDGHNGGFLYFSDAQGGTISRVELPAFDGSANSVNATSPHGDVEVLVSGVVDPMGIALEPNGPRLFFTLHKGSIRAVARDGSRYLARNRAATASVAAGTDDETATHYEVRRLDSGIRLDGIAVAASSEGSGNDPTELRLYWAEFGRAPALKRSSLDGTRVECIQVTLTESENTSRMVSLVWPRSLAFGVGNCSGLLFVEQLGAIRRLPDLPEKRGAGAPETIVEVDSYPAAAAVHTLMWRAAKEGHADKYFTELLR